MYDPSSFVNPTPLAHADTSRDVLPRGGTSQACCTNQRSQTAQITTQLNDGASQQTDCATLASLYRFREPLTYESTIV
ncbi:hypothetical protein TNCV_5081311 [Trichonephila clavipes]|nr:hypothetical protein TNCV_5081311 [Trichonephila clavipes]